LARQHGLSGDVIEKAPGPILETQSKLSGPRPGLGVRRPPIERPAIADPWDESAVQVNGNPVMGLFRAGNGGIDWNNVAIGQGIGKAYPVSSAPVRYNHAAQMTLDGVSGIPITPKPGGLQIWMKLIGKFARCDLVKIGVEECEIRCRRRYRYPGWTKTSNRLNPLL